MAASVKIYHKQLINITKGSGNAGIDVGSSGEFIKMTYDTASTTNYVKITDSDSLVRASAYYISVKTTGIELGGIGSYANDAAAAAGSVAIGDLYINSGTGAITQRLV